jgi:hypothetical protein
MTVLPTLQYADSDIISTVELMLESGTRIEHVREQ